MKAGQCRPGSQCCNPSRTKTQDFGRGRKVVFGIARTLAWICAVAFLIGCNDGRPRRVPVSGQVLIDGQPLSCGDLKFVPEGARPSYGKLDSNGRFTLTCYDGNDGVVPGLHRVGVSASEVKQDQTTWHAPIKYANFRTSGITVQIDRATDSLVIELGSDGRQATVRQ
jgi:hypothetical protein